MPYAVCWVTVRWFSVSLILAATLAACASPEGRDRAAEHDSNLRASWDAWYQRQAAMDCVAEPYDEEAIEAVLRAFRGDSKQ